MKLIKYASGKQALKLSQTEWLLIGYKQGWIKQAQNTSVPPQDFQTRNDMLDPLNPSSTKEKQETFDKQTKVDAPSGHQYDQKAQELNKLRQHIAALNAKLQHLQSNFPDSQQINEIIPAIENLKEQENQLISEVDPLWRDKHKNMPMSPNFRDKWNKKEVPLPTDHLR